MPPKKQTNKSASLSQAQEEEMSSALIAKLLAQDAMNDGGGDYYAEYSNDSRHYDSYQGRGDDFDDNYEDESDDYAPKRYGKPKKAKAKKIETQPRGSKRKSVPVDNDATTTTEAPSDPTQPSDSTTQDNGEKPTKIKKVKKPLPPGFNSGVYTDSEEVLFLEGLNLHGRSWNDLARHMGTRDPHSIRSHAQKHFIKLYRDKLPLPDKVKESGEGFTLSGKPLDPDSAAARSYLSRPAPGTNKTSNGTTKAAKTNTQTPVNSNTSTDESIQMNGNYPSTESADTSESVRMAEQTMTALTIGSLNADQQSSSPSPSSSSSSTNKKAGSSSPKSKKKLTKQQKPIIDSPEATYEGNGRTNYASSRLRRPRSRNSINFRQLGQDDDPLTMVKCEPFVGKPGSNTAGSQPFEMTVHSNVLLMMDFHAHLMTTEIIGFLAGEWDKTTRRILVKEAYPCRSLNTGQNDVNVEMDPTSALETRHLIEEKNMTVVGWYHSHPTFIPDPSLVDIENQCNYQNLCRDECHPEDPAIETTQSGQSVIVEPFVGAIVGPYDPKLPASASVINWFHVNNDWNQGRIPKRLVYDLQEDSGLSQEEESRLFQLPVEYKSSSEKVNFGEHWRHDVQETKLEKLIKSLAARMPWIQQKVAMFRQQQDAAAANDDGDVTMEEQLGVANEVDGGVVDSFLEKVQDTLKAW